jgi:hypothetical protein
VPVLQVIFDLLQLRELSIGGACLLSFPAKNTLKSPPLTGRYGPVVGNGSIIGYNDFNNLVGNGSISITYVNIIHIRICRIYIPGTKR